MNAVDALLREGHGHQLARETGVREDLLIATHGRGEDRLPTASESQWRAPTEGGTVLQDQMGPHCFSLQKPRESVRSAGRY